MGIAIHRCLEASTVPSRQAYGMDLQDSGYGSRYQVGKHSSSLITETVGNYDTNARVMGPKSVYDIEKSSNYDRMHFSSGESSSDNSRRLQRRFEQFDGEGLSSAKRTRFPYMIRENSDDDTPVPIPVRKTQQLMIGDEHAVEKVYQTRFKDMQQSACRVMGKAFVKLIEPKKQKHYPYTKGDDKAPPWWPKTIGENRVRYKEPDHLLRPERIRLLIHILRMVVQPVKNQQPAVQKQGLNIRKLEEITMEAMSNWFADLQHPENSLKGPSLKEIFKIAKAEERYLNQEIGESSDFKVNLEADIVI
ncbi:hypothetical protein BDZ45DRAFT_393465 [Acephala macrosclerotiorum]|nr:hypothetical protein BDZ45DRAFT_393465 [Acephala macrosclerotiorum]